MYVRGKRLQKGSSALQQRKTDGRRHTRETTETGACDYTPEGAGRVGVTKKAENRHFYPNFSWVELALGWGASRFDSNIYIFPNPT